MCIVIPGSAAVRHNSAHTTGKNTALYSPLQPSTTTLDKIYSYHKYMVQWTIIGTVLTTFINNNCCEIFNEQMQQPSDAGKGTLSSTLDIYGNVALMGWPWRPDVGKRWPCRFEMAVMLISTRLNDMSQLLCRAISQFQWICMKYNYRYLILNNILYWSDLICSGTNIIDNDRPKIRIA